MKSVLIIPVIIAVSVLNILQGQLVEGGRKCSSKVLTPGQFTKCNFDELFGLINLGKCHPGYEKTKEALFLGSGDKCADEGVTELNCFLACFLKETGILHDALKNKNSTLHHRNLENNLNNSKTDKKTKGKIKGNQKGRGIFNESNTADDLDGNFVTRSKRSQTMEKKVQATSHHTNGHVSPKQNNTPSSRNVKTKVVTKTEWTKKSSSKLQITKQVNPINRPKTPIQKNQANLNHKSKAPDKKTANPINKSKTAAQNRAISSSKSNTNPIQNKASPLIKAKAPINNKAIHFSNSKTLVQTKASSTVKANVPIKNKAISSSKSNKPPIQTKASSPIKGNAPAKNTAIPGSKSKAPVQSEQRFDGKHAFSIQNSQRSFVDSLNEEQTFISDDLDLIEEDENIVSDDPDPMDEEGNVVSDDPDPTENDKSVVSDDPEPIDQDQSLEDKVKKDQGMKDHSKGQSDKGTTKDDKTNKGQQPNLFDKDTNTESYTADGSDKKQKPSRTNVNSKKVFESTENDPDFSVQYYTNNEQNLKDNENVPIKKSSSSPTLQEQNKDSLPISQERNFFVDIVSKDPSPIQDGRSFLAEDPVSTGDSKVVKPKHVDNDGDSKSDSESDEKSIHKLRRSKINRERLNHWLKILFSGSEGVKSARLIKAGFIKCHRQYSQELLPKDYFSGSCETTYKFLDCFVDVLMCE